MVLFSLFHLLIISHDPFVVLSSITEVLRKGLDPYTTGAIKLEDNHNRFM